jgi:AcrR family transcriptional regulator
MGRRAGVTSEETRADLLTAALQEFEKHGYDGTKVSDIASSAGVTSGAIYNHYPSKAKLLAAAIRQSGPGVFLAEVRGDRTKSVVDGFRAAGVDLGGRRDASRSALILEMVAAARRDPAVATTVREIMVENERIRTELIRRAQDDGEISTELDAATLSRYTSMMSLGSVVLRALEVPPVAKTRWTKLIDVLLDAVGPRRPAWTSGRHPR